MRRPPRPALRAGLAFRREPLTFLQAIDGGRALIQFRAGFSEFTLIKSPEIIHHVLVSAADSFGEGKWTLRGERVMGDCLITREGDPHRDRRALLQPSFDRARLDRKATALTERAECLSEGWHDGDEIEARAGMSRVALEAAGDALFSLDLGGDSEALVPALGMMLHEIPRPGLPWPSGRRLAASRRVVDEMVLNAVAERRASAVGHDDVLSLLIRHGQNGGGSLSDRQIADEIASLMIASIDTTPGTLAWAWHLLARHPEVESRVHEELDTVLGDRPPTASDLPRLEYLDLVISEVLRLYPPVHFIDRRPLVDVELDGRRLPAGSFLLISPLLTHRDPRFYPEPSAFLPERWAPADRAERPRYAYLPFGGGPHTCIGMTLARMELELVIATLARRWRMRPAPSFPAAPTPQTKRFPMRLESR